MFKITSTSSTNSVDGVEIPFGKPLLTNDRVFAARCKRVPGLVVETVPKPTPVVTGQPEED